MPINKWNRSASNVSTSLLLRSHPHSAHTHVIVLNAMATSHRRGDSLSAWPGGSFLFSNVGNYKLCYVMFYVPLLLREIPSNSIP